ncbi:MAG TPA: VIT1/CCC1 transporter family protein [Candidatus Saccharimonadales bacterium]|nr:VIT1/CCC1 transporter family protein [Candidatus Saccharimonadales bacterium]
MAEHVKRPTESQFQKHLKKEKHKHENPLRDIILGGQDGLVNALGIILGVMAASSDVKILIATVLAATIAESFSMGAVAYTSALSQRDYYDSERKKEKDEVDKFPEMEKEEIRRIYEKKGFKGKILEEIVTTITHDKKLWVDTMMAEELKITPVDTKAVLKSSVIVTIATAIGHLIPLVPFLFVTNGSSLLIAVIISGITLFAVGAYQAVSLVGSWWKSGIRMVIIGLAAAFIGYFIARLFHATA